MALGSFANLRPYQVAAAQPVENPLNALIQGFQQGQAIQQLPQTIQQDALNKQLQQEIALAKLQQLQTGSVENVGGRLVRVNPSTGQVEVILDSSPETQQFIGLVNNQPLMVGSKSGNFSIGKLPQGVDLTGGISPKVTPSETFTTVNTDQGLVRTGNRSTTAAPLTMGDAQLTKPVTSANVKQITDANGFLFTQALTGGPLTAVLNEDGTPFNAGVPNRVFTSDQGVFALPTKSTGTPTPTALTTPGAEGQPPVQLTKTTGKGGKEGEAVSSVYQEETALRNLESVNDLRGRVGLNTVGVGSMLSAVPGTEAANFEADLQTLKANIAFGALAQMRAASKTGGALGNVSNKETALLESTLGALDRKQSPENFTKNLDRIEASINRWQEAAKKQPIATSEETIIIIDSTGAPHTILKGNLDAARKRDPGLKVQ